MNTLIVKMSEPGEPMKIGNVTVPTRAKITDRRLCRKCLITHMNWEADKKNLDSKQKKDVSKMTKNIYDGA